MTQPTSKHVTQETHIQPLLESVGLLLDGPATLNKIRLSRSLLTIATTLIDLCARNSDTDQTTEENQTPSPVNPSSPSTTFTTSNLHTFEPSHRIWFGTHGLIISSADMDTLLRSLDANGGSLEDVMTLPYYGRRLLM